MVCEEANSEDNSSDYVWKSNRGGCGNKYVVVLVSFASYCNYVPTLDSFLLLIFSHAIVAVIAAIVNRLKVLVNMSESLEHVHIRLYCCGQGGHV